jgi:hypothetical protein
MNDLLHAVATHDKGVDPAVGLLGRVSVSQEEPIITSRLTELLTTNPPSSLGQCRTELVVEVARGGDSV